MPPVPASTPCRIVSQLYIVLYQTCGVATSGGLSACRQLSAPACCVLWKTPKLARMAVRPLPNTS